MKKYYSEQSINELNEFSMKYFDNDIDNLIQQISMSGKGIQDERLQLDKYFKDILKEIDESSLPLSNLFRNIFQEQYNLLSTNIDKEHWDQTYKICIVHIEKSDFEFIISDAGITQITPGKLLIFPITPTIGIILIDPSEIKEGQAFFGAFRKINGENNEVEIIFKPEYTNQFAFATNLCTLKYAEDFVFSAGIENLEKIIRKIKFVD